MGLLVALLALLRVPTSLTLFEGNAARGGVGGGAAIVMGMERLWSTGEGRKAAEEGEEERRGRSNQTVSLWFLWCGG